MDAIALGARALAEANDRQRGTPTAAAEAFGWVTTTYLAYERPPGSSKHTRLNDASAQRYAQAFKVNWLWLLKGQGSPFKSDITPEQARLLSATVGMAEPDIARITDMITTIQRRSGTG